MKNEDKFLPIFSQRLAGYLMYNGFVLGSMRPDLNGSGKNVFFFMKSDELFDKINEYKSNR